MFARTSILVSVILFCLLQIIFPITTRAQIYDQNINRSNYIFNFANNTTWPNEKNLDVFKIATYQINPALHQRIIKLARVKRLKGLPVVVYTVSTLEGLAGKQLVVTGRNLDIKSEEVLDLLKGNPTLWISQGSLMDFMINMFLIEGTLNYQINIANIIPQGLKVNDDMLKYAISDPRNRKEMLRKAEGSLVKERQKVANRDALLIQHQKELDRQQKLFNDYDDSIRIKTREIEKITEQLETGKALVADEKRNLIELRLENEEKKNIILEKQKVLLGNLRQLKNLTLEIAEQRKILAEQERKIQRQKEELLYKEEKIADSTGQIKNQRYIILLISLLLVIILFLGIFSYRSLNKTKLLTEELHLSNLDLEEKVIVRTSALQEALEEKEIMLREIHHRVKNNLSVVVSMIKMQRRGTKDNEIKKVLFDTQSRIMAMSSIHEKLYKSDSLAIIDLQEYFNSLTNTLLRTYTLSKNIKLDIAVDEGLDLDISKIIPLGLIMNELVTNSLKYAFNETESPKIIVRLRKEEDECAFSYHDNGKGLPKGFDWEKAESLGLILINSLVQQLKGKIYQMEIMGLGFQIMFSQELRSKETVQSL